MCAMSSGCACHRERAAVGHVDDEGPEGLASDCLLECIACHHFPTPESALSVKVRQRSLTDKVVAGFSSRSVAHRTVAGSDFDLHPAW